MRFTYSRRAGGPSPALRYILDSRMDCLVQVMDSSCFFPHCVAVPLSRPFKTNVKDKKNLWVHLC